MDDDVVLPDLARAAAVLLHPHPDFGGDRHNLVVDALFRALPGHGIGVLRFDLSSSQPEAAAADAVAALDRLEAAAGEGPLLFLAGYSFGADVALTVTDPRVAGWLAVAPPLGTVPLATMAAAHDPRPKRVLVPEHDQFSPAARTRHLTEGWAATTVETVAGADHFLYGRTGPVVDGCVRFVDVLRRGAP